MENLRATVTDDEVRLSGNDAVMARLLVDDDNENDPVPYEDEATADHKYAQGSNVVRVVRFQNNLTRNDCSSSIWQR